ncbi:MAG: serine/threonine-protein kinase [Myxococcota bacterium]
MTLSSDAHSLPRPFGAYTLHRRLAVGGMAEVYVATARGFGGFEKLLALKLLHPRLADDARFVRMLVEEAKLSVLLSHANIVETFDLGMAEGRTYLAMELVDGADAAALFRRSGERQERLPLDLCAYIVAEACRGLHHAHRAEAAGVPLRIVHRDVSPQNLLLSFRGEVKLADFGIAKAVAQGRSTSEAGSVRGKYYYMSPEQVRGEALDHRSDVFSAGLVLHELLCNRMVYREPDLPRLLARVRAAEIAPPSTRRGDVTPALDAVVRRACARDPARRFQSAGSMASALDAARADVFGGAPSVRLAELMRRFFPERAAQAEDTERVAAAAAEAALLASAADARRREHVEVHMRQAEYRPDPANSRVFADVTRTVRVATARAAMPGDAMPEEVSPGPAARDPATWVDAGAGPALRGGDELAVAAWLDATLVDDTGEVERRVRDMLEREVASRLGAGAPRMAAERASSAHTRSAGTSGAGTRTAGASAAGPSAAGPSGAATSGAATSAARAEPSASRQLSRRRAWAYLAMAIVLLSLGVLVGRLLR